ncbi:MAG: hypothetical protein H6993_09080 [Pseudomonadales bacterium]|nr:hypothetical protein [Pseudomonadales bacterium]MCP5184102.1 hypothetical protein [Pseudomonadales bacterium]
MSTTEFDLVLAADTGLHSSVQKDGKRRELAEDVEAFLRRGGNIAVVPDDYRADPPRKPESNYGRGSI